MKMDIGPDEDDDFTDIREQIFHNTVREQIVSNLMFIINDNKNRECHSAKMKQKNNQNFGIKNNNEHVVSYLVDNQIFKVQCWPKPNELNKNWLGNC